MAAPYLMRLCPHHKEKRPSFSVNTATGWGRCFACGTSSRVDDVSPMQALKPVRAVDAPRFDDEYVEGSTTHCHRNTSVEYWLASRGIDIDTAAYLCFRAQRDSDGVDWLVFVYRDANFRPVYWKRRKADGTKETMPRFPSGSGTILFNVAELADLHDHEEPMIVEGELDVAALHRANVRGVVSVPDGAGSRVSRALLEPLLRFNSVLVGVDTDDAGDGLATRIAEVLGPSRCKRVDWRVR